MTAEEMKQKFNELYQLMATSANVNYMKAFGNVHKEMMEWFIANKPDMAKEWLEKLCAIKWKNYLTQREADKIVSAMEPKAPWTYTQWESAMGKNGYAIEQEPFYNSYALWVTMNMIMSDSSVTLQKYIGVDDLFKAVYELAIDKLMDKDGKFAIRHYFLL
jgi:hypothetical protein